jgi:hypothetical protein
MEMELLDLSLERLYFNTFHYEISLYLTSKGILGKKNLKKNTLIK